MIKDFKIGHTRIIIMRNKSEAELMASLIISREIRNNPNLKIGLASGETMKQVYKNLIKFNSLGEIDFSKIKSFNLDEYEGLSPEDRNSFRSFMDKKFFSKINIQKKNINFLRGNTKDWKKECARFEKKIKMDGGIDLQILGIGVNGHIGFNEPNTSFSARTHLTKLSEMTKLVNRIHFFPRINVPNYALTMGIKTILSARKIILVATGRKKSHAVAESILGEMSEFIPASALRKNTDVTFVLDKDSAHELLSRVSGLQ